MKHFNNMIFWKKLVLISIIPLLIISLVIGVLSYNRASLAAQESSKNNLIDAVNRIDISLTVRTRLINNTVQTIAACLDMASLSEDGSVSAAEAFEFCVRMTEPFQEISSISILLEDQLIYGTQEDVTLDSEAVSSLYDQAIRYPGKTCGSGVTDCIFQEHQQGGASAILVSRGLTDETNRTVGLLVLELDANSFGSIILNKQKIIDDQINFLVDGNQEMVYCATSISNDLFVEAFEQYRLGKRIFTFEYKDKTYFCCAQYNGMVGWVTFIAIEWDALFPQAEALRSYIAIMDIVCVLVAFILLMVLSVLITKPLAKLNDGMKQVLNSDFEVHLENNRKDEIGELTDSFNYMVDQIRTLINRVYLEQLAQKNAEMEALQAQINPHFLYNSLDSINWMLIERDEMDISSVGVARGKLMQYSMDTSKSQVPLREEYRNARDYLLIQRSRLEDQLGYELDLEPGLEEFQVPKLILQPLIENAIKYGVLASQHRCKVTVETRRHMDKICITVTDDGAGMNEEKLSEYWKLLNGSSEGQKNIGIRNVARRLQLHFNKKCEFYVTSIPGQGTSVSLLLPIIPKGECPD